MVDTTDAHRFVLIVKKALKMLKTEPIYRGHEIDYVVNGMRRMADIKSIELHMIS